ncbi:MAG TPA: right-handed parallel beta-helix repeat-containing protein [Pseudoduganella sp.]
MPEPRAGKRRLKPLLVLSLVAAGSVAAAWAGAAWFLDSRGITPRALAPYVAKRSSGHNPLIEKTGSWMQQTLLSLDRGSPYVTDERLYALRPGAAPAALPPALRVVPVTTSAEARLAIRNALPGDAITFAPGDYLFRRGDLQTMGPGTEAHPVVVRAARPGTVEIAIDSRVGFNVTAPYWTFENLLIRGACRSQHACDHAFHVTGGAHHFSARNNTITDFNSHFKINAVKGRFPDHGAIVGNTITNSTIRATASPVTPIDLVAASHWTIRGNVITDFLKGSGDRISYGGYAKGAGSHNVFEQNIVVCEHKLRGRGQRVGLSLGGGGTGKPYCRDGQCITEQDDSVIRANLIASCSDDGIYLNRAARSEISHNTLLDTGGVVARFAASSADVEGNLVDGAIRSRDDGVLRLKDNIETGITALYAGRHPVRDLFAGASVAALSWVGEIPRRKNIVTSPGVDLCGRARPQLPAFGAFEHATLCKN